MLQFDCYLSLGEYLSRLLGIFTTRRHYKSGG
ncbi:Bgt-50290 [Blumeria graminis f. sp. tritici]|uniref:Bgt-50290 n=1 Tax=Blumeria graminis f. sp. tritici TaxID=62690 RepID=A0A9X9QDY7_BLUGR|nr:Bgt-50290 [Blumeria graminis f. sp. tritici]